MSTCFAEEIASLLEVPEQALDNVEELYLIGYQCYEKGDYTSAAQFFTKLVLSQPFCGKYWFGLASSRQMQKEYLAALQAWTSVALLEEKDPFPHFHAAECLFSLNEKEEALKALQAAEGLLPENHVLRNKISLLKQVHFHAY